MTDAAQKIAERVPLPEPSFQLKWKDGAYYVSKPRIDGTPCYTAAQMEALRLAVAAEALRGAEAVAKIERAPNGMIGLFRPDGGPFDMSKYVGAKLYTAPPAPAPNPWREAVLDALSAVGDIRAAAAPAEVVRELIRREVMIATDESLRPAGSVEVTDAMVERACAAYYVDDAWKTNTNRTMDYMRAALTAALQEPEA